MIPNLEDKIKEKFPQEYKKWDEWNYKIYSPLSFDDWAQVEVHLINKNGIRQKLIFPLGGKV
jgi:hypothetical protein